MVLSRTSCMYPCHAQVHDFFFAVPWPHFLNSAHTLNETMNRLHICKINTQYRKKTAEIQFIVISIYKHFVIPPAVEDGSAFFSGGGNSCPRISICVRISLITDLRLSFCSFREKISSGSANFHTLSISTYKGILMNISQLY